MVCKHMYGLCFNKTLLTRIGGGPDLSLRPAACVPSALGTFLFSFNQQLVLTHHTLPHVPLQALQVHSTPPPPFQSTSPAPA